jgi:hypothetical protein
MITNDKMSIAEKKLAKDLFSVSTGRKMSVCIEDNKRALGFGTLKPVIANLEKAGSFRVHKRSNSILSSATRAFSVFNK